MTLRIRFHPSADPPPELIPFPASALRDLLHAEGLTGRGEVNCVLTDDVELEELNRRFRGRSGPTVESRSVCRSVSPLTAAPTTTSRTVIQSQNMLIATPASDP